MIKTLLAGTLLSTGLLAGGAVGAEDVKRMKNYKLLLQIKAEI